MDAIEQFKRRKRSRKILLILLIISSVSFYFLIKIKGFDFVEPFIVPIVFFFWILAILTLNSFNIALSPFKWQSAPGKTFDEVNNEKAALTDEFVQIVGNAIKEGYDNKENNIGQTHRGIG